MPTSNGLQASLISMFFQISENRLCCWNICKVPPLELLQPMFLLPSNYSNSGKTFKKCSLNNRKIITGNSLSSQGKARGRRNLREIPYLYIRETFGFWRASVRLTVRCGESTAGALRQITKVGGLGLVENYTGLSRGFGVYTLIERSVRKHTVIREAAPDSNGGFEDSMWAYICGNKRSEEIHTIEGDPQWDGLKDCVSIWVYHLCSNNSVCALRLGRF